MRHWIRTALAVSICSILHGALPPLVDRDAFFGEIKITAAQISPDGKYVSFLKPHNGTRNIWVKKVEDPFSAAKPVSAESKRPIRNYFWSRNGRYLLYAQDEAGDENFNVFAIDPSAPPASGSEVPPVRNITEAKGARAMIYALPKTDPGVMYIGLNDRDKAWHDLYKLDMTSGSRTLLRKNTDRIAEWIFDNKGMLRLARRKGDNGNPSSGRGAIHADLLLRRPRKLLAAPLRRRESKNVLDEQQGRCYGSNRTGVAGSGNRRDDVCGARSAEAG